MSCQFHTQHPERPQHDGRAMAEDCAECERDKYDFAEQAYVGKLLDACDTDEERNMITDFFAG